MHKDITVKNVNLNFASVRLYRHTLSISFLVIAVTLLFSVDASAAAPSLSFSWSPSTIYSGESTHRAWSSSNATQCVGRDGVTSIGTSGQSIHKPQTASMSVTITCTGPGGSVSQTANLTVLPPPPAPTLSFAWYPSTIYAGQTSHREWQASNADTCIGDNGSSVGTSGSSGENVQTSNQSRTMTCSGPGGSVSSTAYLTVLQPAPSQAPQLSGPSNVEVNTNFTVSRSSVADASSYKLYKNGSLVTSNAGATESLSLSSSGPSNFTMTACNSSGCGPSSSTLTISAGVSAVRGYIEGVHNDGYDSYLQGWACQTYDNRSIEVQVWAGGAANTGTRIAIGVANQTSGSSISNECSNSGTQHRFSVLLPPSERVQHAGQTIYVHGISNRGTTHVVLGNSGTKTVPTLPIPATPAKPSGPASVEANKPISLTWAATSGASTYDVYRNGVRIKENAGFSHSDTVSNVGVYQYTLQACNAAGCQESAALDISVIEPTTVKGHVDGLSQSNGDYYLNGWACQTYYAEPISVNIFTNGGQVLGTGVADKTSEQAINNACSTNAPTAHRYKILLSSAVMAGKSGDPIHVQGLSNQGTGSVYLYNSGNFTIPNVAIISEWSAQSVTVGQNIVLQNADPAITECQATSHPAFKVKIEAGVGKAYTVSQTAISDWQCMDNQANVVLAFSSPLTIEPLATPQNLKRVQP
jgi:hypothetical protein